MPDPGNIPSGFAYAGKIARLTVGSRELAYEDIWSCRSCGQLTLPKDAGIHEDDHTQRDQLNTAIRALLQAEMAYGHQHQAYDQDGEKGKLWAKAVSKALNALDIKAMVIQIPQ